MDMNTTLQKLNLSTETTVATATSTTMNSHFNYDPNSRRFTMKSQIGDTKTLEVFKIEIALLDGNNRSTRYEMTIVYRCGWDELDNFV